MSLFRVDWLLGWVSNLTALLGWNSRLSIYCRDDIRPPAPLVHMLKSL